MNKKGMIRTAVILLVLAGLVVMYYTHLTKRNKEATSMEAVEISAVTEMTEVQRLIAQSKLAQYPATPVQLIKRYNEIMVCFYNEEWTETELRALAQMLRSYFDVELLAQQTDEEYFEALKADIMPFREQKITIYSTEVAPSTDVRYYEHNGYECASLTCNYTLKQMINSNIAYDERQQIFVLRKDPVGHWCIFGFQETEKKEIHE